ncbi:MAG: SOS response-associated peptidase family protein [Bacteriovoracaceae bacterium]|nr:SOS response-associated peptidase family protein [Bacteriovoracaceae bacterium]
MCFSLQVDINLKKLAARFQAEVSQNDFDRFYKMASKDPEKYKGLDTKGRIYPNCYAPIVFMEQKGQRIIKPMKYQLLPSFSESNRYRRLNPKTNRKILVHTYNARLDKLEERRAWKNVFMKNHALVPFRGFYEYLPRQGKKELAYFAPDNLEVMWAACLWDCWRSQDGQEEIFSFAVITDEAPKEVVAAGHDRVPIFLKESLIDKWLKPYELNKAEAYATLKCRETVNFKHNWDH